MITMISTVKFDRDIDKNKHYISPGGYCIDFKDKSISFDFMDYYGTVDKNDNSILYIEQYNLDTSSFPESVSIADELCKPDNIQKISEFFVYTGEEYRDPIIIPIKVLSILFEIDVDDKHTEISVPNEILNDIKL